jgi:hypothetical protein
MSARLLRREIAALDATYQPGSCLEYPSRGEPSDERYLGTRPLDGPALMEGGGEAREARGGVERMADQTLFTVIFPVWWMIRNFPEQPFLKRPVATALILAGKRVISWLLHLALKVRSLSGNKATVMSPG